jgi:uncharacterized protein
MRFQAEMLQNLPSKYARQLDKDENFQFRCHPGVQCFNECCRQLELVITPYDVLRLKGALGLSSDEFLERYALVEYPEDAAWPRVYLCMVDDGRDSCPFVSPEGCRVYADRPGACRMYPLGRGVRRRAGGGEQQDLYMLLREPHCLGFADSVAPLNASQWFGDQDLPVYNGINDQMMPVLYPEAFNLGWRPDQSQCDKFLLALYNLDEFRRRLFAADSDLAAKISEHERDRLAADELALLRYACRWLHGEVFGRRGVLGGHGCSVKLPPILDEEKPA